MCKLVVECPVKKWDNSNWKHLIPEFLVNWFEFKCFPTDFSFVFFCKALIAHSHLCSTYFFNLPQNWYEYTVQTCMLSNLKGHQIPCFKRPPLLSAEKDLMVQCVDFTLTILEPLTFDISFVLFFGGGGRRRCDYRMSALLLTKLLSHYFYSVKLLNLLKVFLVQVLNCNDNKGKAIFLSLSPQVTKLCDLASDGDSVTSVSWSERV